jgi:ATP-dependent DNA helicase RecG
MESAIELINQLNLLDEHGNIEAKRGQEIDRSILETVCAFSNEPDLGGGILLLGVESDEGSPFPLYKVIGVKTPEKLQADLASACASVFNLPVRPRINVEQIDGRSVLSIFVAELPKEQKPLFFQSQGLPKGAFRRIGSTDQRCTEDDLLLFYQYQTQTFDGAIVPDSSLIDLDEDAIQLYRATRRKVNPSAEELTFNKEDLLLSLGAIKKVDGDFCLTFTGLIVFGTRKAQRRLIPAHRVDYIRVPGKEWVADPQNRFTSVDMRGPLIGMVQRIYDAVMDDLPKGFMLPENSLQAISTGLPGRVLREAIVNALMHRSYRIHQPVQVIRYSNRIELINPGYSLKPEDQLGEPGSTLRNPLIAAIFHETNMAESKGSGIRTMRKLMKEAQLAPPTFESDHNANQFTTRLLLHHFLDANDLEWLKRFSVFNLTMHQQQALIFIREVGAIDNLAFRQLSGFDTLKASSELRRMRDFDLLEAKGKGRATYYIPGEELLRLMTPPPSLMTPPPGLMTPPPSLMTPPPGQGKGEPLPQSLAERIKNLGHRASDKKEIKSIILELCSLRPFSLAQLAIILGRKERYLVKHFLRPLRREGKLAYTHPEIPNHPQQAYLTIKD